MVSEGSEITEDDVFIEFGARLIQASVLSL